LHGAYSAHETVPNHRLEFREQIFDSFLGIDDFDDYWGPDESVFAHRVMNDAMAPIAHLGREYRRPGQAHRLGLRDDGKVPLSSPSVRTSLGQRKVRIVAAVAVDGSIGWQANDKRTSYGRVVTYLRRAGIKISPHS
jgi:hypothetical protein